MRYLLVLLLLFFESFAKDIEFQEVSKANINSILIFSSQDGLNSGVYHFKDIGISLYTLHLPLKYHFDSNKSWNFFINGDLSFSRAYVSKHTLEPYTASLARDSSIDTYIGGVGTGVRYKFGNGLSFTNGFELLYSRVGVKLGQAGVEDTIKNFFDDNYNENISYKFESSLDYFQEFEKYKMFASLAYRLYETKSSVTFDALKSFQSESSVITLSIGTETPPLLHLERNYFTLEAKLYENFLHGTVANSSKVNRYTSMSAHILKHQRASDTSLTWEQVDSISSIY
jgi:hypothetical protein